MSRWGRFLPLLSLPVKNINYLHCRRSVDDRIMRGRLRLDATYHARAARSPGASNGRPNGRPHVHPGPDPCPNKQPRHLPPRHGLFRHPKVRQLLPLSQKTSSLTLARRSSSYSAMAPRTTRSPTPISTSPIAGRRWFFLCIGTAPDVYISDFYRPTYKVS